MSEQPESEVIEGEVIESEVIEDGPQPEVSQWDYLTATYLMQGVPPRLVERAVREALGESSGSTRKTLRDWADDPCPEVSEGVVEEALLEEVAEAPLEEVDGTSE